MSMETVRIIVNGATGGIVNRQHLEHALMPIIREGGLRIGNKTVMPELLLVARDEAKLAKVAKRYGIARWTTDLASALSDESYPIFFDAGFTGQRPVVVRDALNAGKHVYAEKPLVPNLEVGRDLLALAKAKDRRHSVVEDKLFLPGIAKLRHLSKQGYFGTVTNFRLDFGYWIFDGSDHPMQRPSWNYKEAEGGSLVLDMYPHWRYVVEGVLGPIKRLVSRSWTSVPRREDESGQVFDVDVDDSNVTIVELESGAIGTISSSWARRVRADDLLTFHIDGAHGSASAGLHRCQIQPAAATPKARFDASVDLGIDYREQWMEVPDVAPFENGYRKGWEAFLRHVIGNEPPAADFTAGMRDVALAQAVARSSVEERWVEMDEVTA